MSTLLFRFFAPVAALILAAPAWAQHPNHPLGTASDRAYQQRQDNIDHVDLFSGSLGLQIPIGPFTLNYSSNVWRYDIAVDGVQVYTEASTDRETNVGLGWYLGWGQVYHPDHYYNTGDQWMLVDDTGARRYFYDDLHKGEDDGDASVFYTRDGSYLRLRVNNNYHVDVEYPDGTTRRYNSFTGGLAATYRFEKSWSRFASASDPDLQVTYSNANCDACDWTITDRHGRTHYVEMTDQYPFHSVVTKVDLEGYLGQRVVYDFDYTVRSLARSCKDDSPFTSSTISVPHLVRVDLPDGSAYTMQDGSGQPDYHSTCASGIDDVTGVLRSIQLPTGGEIAWEWQEFEFPPGDNSSVFNTSAGVSKRHLRDENGVDVGTWRYRTTQIGAGPDPLNDPADDPQLITEVAYPTGDCTKHFFNALYYQFPSAGRGWEYALPFVYSEQVAGRYLSSQTWSASTGGGQCTGTKLRSSYLRYRHDAVPGNTTSARAWYDTNRTVEQSRTVFHDDGDRWVDEARQEFDGLGHFRKVITTGNLWDDTVIDERRVRVTGFDASSGVYPGTYVPKPVSDPWILGTYTHEQIQEPDVLELHGLADPLPAKWLQRREYVFDPSTGVLECVRVLAGGARGPSDVVTLYEHDSLGQITAVKTFGGDPQALSTASPCGSLPSQPERWIEHTYSGGVLVSSRQRSPSGTAAPFYLYDVDVDPSSGLVTTSRDLAGFPTHFDYDALGRLRSVSRAAGAEREIEYTPASAGQPAKMRSSLLEPNTRGAAPVLARQETLLDAFGRPWRQRVLRPDGGWSERETLYNGRGWRTSVSQWGDLGEKTEVLSFDAFGRATVVRPPDGAAHDVLIDYDGIRRTTRQQKVAQPGGEAYASRIYERDRYGRLRRVEEPSGSGGAMVGTSFWYDAGGRQVRSVIGATTAQERRRLFDGRGFLLEEQVPELGTTGNGSVVHSEHDVRGLARRLQDGARDLRTAYDAWGRPTEVRNVAAGNRLVKKLEYDSGLGWGDGKLHRATRYNWVYLPWSSSGVEELVTVEETLAYQGAFGATSSKELELVVDGATYSFTQSYGYDVAGRLDSQTYGGATTNLTFTHGELTSVAGWADIAYHPSLAVASVSHANQVVESRAMHPDFTRRPGVISITGASQGWSTGTIAYDGAGNVKQVGANDFAYDAVSRLVSSDAHGWDQEFTYDAFGNLREVESTPPGGSTSSLLINVDASTNRLSSPAVSYDAAGNQTGWLSTTYAFDESNRLKQESFWSGAPQSFAHVYSAADERVASLGALYPQSTPTLRITERGLGQELLVERSYVGGVLSDLTRYAWAGGRPLGADDASGRRHFHLDHLGSVRRVTDAQGTVVVAEDFLPYGDPTINTASLPETLQFTGHERDGALDSMHARHYARMHGRFLSVDPVRGSSARPQSLNRYGYVQGNPMTLVDPDGRQPTPAQADLVSACAGGSCNNSDWSVAVLSAATPDSVMAGTSVLETIVRTATSFGLAGMLSRGALLAVTTTSATSYTQAAMTGDYSQVDSAIAASLVTGGMAGDDLLSAALAGASTGAINAILLNWGEENGEVITVTAEDPLKEGEKEDAGDKEDVVEPSPEPDVKQVCAYGICLWVPVDANEDDVRGAINAAISLQSLHNFHCQLSPLTCGGGGQSQFCDASQFTCDDVAF